MLHEPTAGEITEVILLNDVKELQQECDLMVNEPEFPIRISAFDLFCQKTGHLIGTRSQASLFALVKICGKDTAGNIYNCTTLNVHPAWLDTSPESLDDLIDSDPVGYAVYCLSLLTAQFYQTKKNQDPKRYAEADRLWSLARANALLSQQGIGGITELNNELARMVSFMPDAANYFFSAIRKYGNTPDRLAMLHCSGDLNELLHNCINETLNNIGSKRAYAAEYIKKTRFIDIAATPEDAARGPSNVRKQRVSKRSIAEASLFSELQKLFGDSGLDKQIQAENLPGSTAWRAKMAARQTASQRQEADLARELAALASVTNLALPEGFDEDENNDVEVRIIPVAEIEQQLEMVNLAPIKEAVMGQMKNRPNLFKQISGEQSQKKLEIEQGKRLTGLALLRSLQKKD